ncbi:hypothetical protein [Candidatus Entotheonella palauensis]|uniref:hypothetical protein n=1 Tax=Candidatus Entotheonella palauensis TaxID=93172 RepID=UPI000B7E432E
MSTYACAALLSRRGWHCDVFAPGHTRAADTVTLVLNDVCETLLYELFPNGGWDRLGYRLHRSDVLWGHASQSQRITRPAIAVRREVLLSHLQAQCRQLPHVVIHDEASPDGDQAAAYAWRINPRSPTPGPPGAIYAGQRVLLASRAHVLADADRTCCYIESVVDGWLFLIPTGGTGAVIQAMLPGAPQDGEESLQNLLAQSWLIAPLINGLEEVSGFTAAPRMHLPLAEPRLLRMGEAAVRLEPLSGEGSAFALRNAILAAAVLTAGSGEEEAVVQQHYQHRLLRSFLAHLDGCVKFYRQAFARHAAWQQEIMIMQHTHSHVFMTHCPPGEHQLSHRLVDLGCQPWPVSPWQ